MQATNKERLLSALLDSSEIKEMKMKYIIGFAVAAAVAGNAFAEKISLFNGKDLSGWTSVADHNYTGGYTATEPSWFVADGAIRATGTPFGYLKTKACDFNDYTLELEYRWWRKTEKPNSGIFVRLVSENGSFIPRCYENQLCMGCAGDILGLSGSPIAGVKPTTPFNAANPLSGISKVLLSKTTGEKPFGEWNKMKIIVKGDTIKNIINGVESVVVKGIADVPGAIALQSEGGAIEFRNIFVTRQ
jgi:hypothetical protein